MIRMKLKYTFEIMEIDDQLMAVPVGENADELHGIVRLNKTGSFIFECLKEDISEEEIVEKLSEKYDSSLDEVKEDVRSYLSQLKEAGLIE